MSLGRPACGVTIETIVTDEGLWVKKNLKLSI